ncbi:hypothetical protein ElyMa_000188700 [Elysia marginata]|uniref:Uncharacterized protein n=1 Tax=Elysia marginata TaxID=1093978 RepID=A0AAV4EUX7_9GAST|nr:hypothetical protein ElyMa_000188700 [Elysia marginata]
MLASGTVDADTLAKFADYTKSMRRDLKQNYKRLSVLMKNFNEQVQEHSRNMTTNGSNDGDADDETFNTDGRGRCLLM